MKREKMLSNFLNIYFSILFVIVFSVILILMEYTEHNIKFLDRSENILEPILGIFLGSIISIVISFFLVIKPKLRILSFALISIPLVLILNFIFNSFSTSFSSIIFLQETLSSFSDGFIFGAFYTTLLYIFLSRFHTAAALILPLLFLFAKLIHSWRSWGILDWEFDIVDQFFNYSIFLLSLFLILYYLLRRFSVKNFEIKKTLHPIYFIVLVLISIISFHGISILFTDLAQKQEEAELILIRQEIIGNVGDFNFENPEANNPWVKSNGDFNFSNINFKISQFPVGFYKATEPIYLKTQVFNASIGKDIKIREEKENLIQRFFYSDYLNRSQKKARIIYKFIKGQNLPTPEYVTWFKDLAIDQEKMILGPGDSNKEIAYYEVNFLDSDDKKVINANAKKYSFLKNKELKNKLRKLAQKITKDEENTLEKAKKIESFLKENYLYSFNPDIGSNENPLEIFLFKNKRGYCTHFALAMSSLLESIDIKSRIVGGFYSDNFDKKLGSYLILSTDLHSWVEVFDKEKGWVQFDPTSSKCNEEFDDCENLRKFFKPGKLNTETQNLQFVKSEMNFDNIFIEKDPNLKELQTAISFDVEENSRFQKSLKSMISSGKKNVEDKKKIAQKRQIEFRAMLKNIIKIIIFFLIGFFVLIVILRLSYYFYLRLKNPGYFKILSDRKKIKKMELKLKRNLIKFGFTDDSLISMPPAEVIKITKKYKEISKEIKNFYNFSDKVLYAKSYEKKDLHEAKRFANEIIRKISK